MQGKHFRWTTIQLPVRLRLPRRYCEGAFYAPTGSQSLAEAIYRYPKSSGPLREIKAFAVVFYKAILSTAARAIGRFRHRAIQWPLSEPFGKRRLIYPKPMSPFSKRCADPAPLDYAIAAFIPSLLSRACPPAIARLVVSGVVDSIDRCTARLLTHILQKPGERLPLLADGNAASAVPRKPAVIRVRASHHHPGPCVVSWANPGHWAMPMLRTARDCLFYFQATARLRAAIPQHNPVKYSFIAALTTAMPLGLAFWFIGGAPDDRPSANSVSGKVDDAHRTMIIDLISRCPPPSKKSPST